MQQRKQIIFRFRIALFLLPLFCGGEKAAAQDYSLAERLGYSAELMAEGFGEDHSFLTLDVRLRFALSPYFSVFVPFDGSELLYDKRGAKHYDFAVKSGLGLRINHGLHSNGELAASLAGLSTIGEANENYWQLRLMGEYVMPASSRYRSICGIGVEYLAPYGPSSRFGGFYLVVSLGIFL